MASQYVTEPATSGLMVLVTSKGPIEVELWATQTPRACRNMLTLAAEGFYDHQIFHRLVPGFAIQTGDPAGTGAGGESIYGEPFRTEPHSRLKFNRRGIVAMAADADGLNESQFFLTLDAAPELQGKHTIIGRVVGKSVYTLLELAQCEMDPQYADRPRYPPKLVTIDVVHHPFTDLAPRPPRHYVEPVVLPPRKKPPKVKKNPALLSFAAEDDDGQGSRIEALKGPKSSHDLLPHHQISPPTSSKVKPSASSTSLSPTIGSKHSSVTTAQIAQNDATSPPSTNPAPSPTLQPEPAKTYLAHLRSKYTLPPTHAGQKRRSKKNDDDYDEDPAYEALLAFQARMRATTSRSTSSIPAIAQQIPPAAAAAAAAAVANVPSDGVDGNDNDDDEDGREYGASDDDHDWRTHNFNAGGQPLPLSNTYTIHDYEVQDPRAPPTPDHNNTTTATTDPHPAKRRRSSPGTQRRTT